MMVLLLRNPRALLAIALIMSSPVTGYAAQSAVAQYEREQGESGGGSIDLENLSEGVRLTVQIGGIPDGAATHPDCGFIAEGKVIDGLFSGAVTRQGVLEGLSPDGDPAEAGLPLLTAMVKQGSIQFDDAATTQYCGGDGYTLEGAFTRKN